MPEQTTRVIRTVSVQSKPADLYGDFDAERLTLLPLRETEPRDLARRLDLNEDLANRVLEAAYERDPSGWQAILRERPELRDDLRRAYSNIWQPYETPLHIADVSAGPALSGTPFLLTVRYQNGGDAPLVLVSVRVAWAGEPFVVEQQIGVEGRDGLLEVPFGEEHTLPVGPAQFEVRLYRDDGARATYRHTLYVLPANPLALSLGPAGAQVTGSWSARGDYLPASDTFLTECEITIANGDPGAVSMNRRISWQFWDGGIGGGTLVESGAFDWPGAVSVPANGVWRGSIWFSSPRGSGIFGVYERKEDMAISVSMTASDGRVVRGDITTRVMLAYGVNIIKVGNFGAQEHVDLYDAVDQMRRIYERRDITLRGVDRRIIDNAAAGSYTILNSEDEFRDMLEDWSCRNDFIDVYVVQDFDWSSFNGYAGGIPGPASKGGRTDGVAVEKTGYTDASGTLRLNVNTLAQLIGHEVGHYLGLSHLEDANNLMRGNTGDRGPDLNYDQYRLMFPHGYMVFE